MCRNQLVPTPSSATPRYLSWSRLGWAGACPKSIQAQGRGLGLKWVRKSVPSADVTGSGARTHSQGTIMRFYNKLYAFYCGVDLHARTMYLCIFDQAGTIVLHKEVPCAPDAFLEPNAPYRDGLVVAPSVARSKSRSATGF
jgi:hypothetical protein